MGPPNIFIPVLMIVGVLGPGVTGGLFEEQLELICRHNLLVFADHPEFAGIECPGASRFGFVERFLREKCRQNYSPWSYDNIKDSVDFFGNCVRFVIDVDQIAADVKNIRLRNELRDVYKKYCLRAPILRECVKYTTDTVGSCLEESVERKTAEIINNAVNAIVEYVCQDDGIRIAIFEEPGTIECISSKKEALLSCANETFGNYIPAKGYAESEAARLGRLATPLIPSDRDCANLDSFQNCSVGLLAECENPSPANLLNSILNSMKMETPCKNLFEIEDFQMGIGNLSSNNETEIVNTTIPLEYNNVTASPSGFINTFKDKCEYNGGTKAYKIAKKAPQHLENCFTSLINTTELEAEVADAVPAGNLDVVFAKYCRKVPNLKKCVRQATKSLKPCLDPEARPSIDVINNVTRALLRFSCQGDGDRLAQFFLTGGPQCIESQSNALKNCAAQIYNKYTPPPGYDEFHRFEAMVNLDSQDCANVREYRRCTVNALRHCEDQSTAETVGSLIESLIKATTCKNSHRG